MAHVHKDIDFVVTAYIVYKDRVLFVHHKKLDMWVAVGGHIELDEDSDEALMREIQEESGLEVEILSQKQTVSSSTNKPLWRPAYLDIHNFGSTQHRHLNLVYFARAKSDKAILAKREHRAIRWLSASQLKDSKYDIPETIRFYAGEALKAAKQ